MSIAPAKQNTAGRRGLYAKFKGNRSARRSVVHLLVSRNHPFGSLFLSHLNNLATEGENPISNAAGNVALSLLTDDVRALFGVINESDFTDHCGHRCPHEYMKWGLLYPTILKLMLWL